MTNIVICIPFYRNHDVVWRVLYHYAHIEIPNTQIAVVAAGSEKEHSKRMAESAGAQYCETLNPPPQLMNLLPQKFNANLMAARKYRPDFVMLTGSDDLISAEWLDFGIKQMVDNNLDCVGLMDSYIAHAKTKEVMYWSGYWGDRKGESIGAGRIVSRKILDKLNWTLWPTNDARTIGNDGRQIERIIGAGGSVHNYYMHDAGCAYYNIKNGNGSLHSWNVLKKIHGRSMNPAPENIQKRFADWWESTEPGI